MMKSGQVSSINENLAEYHDVVLKNPEVSMNPLKWKKVAEVQGRLDADLIKSLLEANGIDVEMVQEALGHSVIPVTIDGLGRVQVFVPQEKASEARELLKDYPNILFVEDQ